MNNSKFNVADMVIGKVLEAMQNSKKVAWAKPWHALNARNVISMKEYQGLNVLILSLFGKDSFYLTFNQASENGGHVKKGSKGIPVTYFNFKDAKDLNGQPIVNAEGKTKQIPFLRYSTVFNLSDCEASVFENDAVKTAQCALKWAKLIEKTKSLTPKLAFVPHEMAERLISICGIGIKYEGNSAHYKPSTHSITLPKIENFKSVPEYYSTCFHEIGHSYAKELDSKHEFSHSTEKYSLEELTGELFANFCLTYCNIDSTQAFDNSIAYLEGWMKKISTEPKALLTAASRAQKRFNLLIERLTGSKTEEDSKEPQTTNNGN